MQYHCQIGQGFLHVGFRVMQIKVGGEERGVKPPASQNTHKVNTQSTHTTDVPKTMVPGAWLGRGGGLLNIHQLRWSARYSAWDSCWFAPLVDDNFTSCLPRLYMKMFWRLLSKLWLLGSIMNACIQCIGTLPVLFDACSRIFGCICGISPPPNEVALRWGVLHAVDINRW